VASATVSGHACAIWLAPALTLEASSKEASAAFREEVFRARASRRSTKCWRKDGSALHAWPLRCRGHVFGRRDHDHEQLASRVLSPEREINRELTRRSGTPAERYRRRPEGRGDVIRVGEVSGVRGESPSTIGGTVFDACPE
jgi:hypothetical protein